MTDRASDYPSGVFVLGMHRSGTSAIASLLDGLGLDGGLPQLMLGADEFNPDGYWEQRPLVEMHDRLLRQLGGFASAPPEVLTATDWPPAVQRSIDDILGRFDRPWFLKDPRQCLLMPAWTNAVGSDDLAVVVIRNPRMVVRSLKDRNGYSSALAVALWESYLRQLLGSLAGRPCHVVHYERLLADPLRETSLVAASVERHTDLGFRLASDSIVKASQRVRLALPAGSKYAKESSDDYLEALQPLYDVALGLDGPYQRFRTPEIPAPSGIGRREVRWRRRGLRLGTMIVSTNLERSAKLDRRS